MEALVYFGAILVIGAFIIGLGQIELGLHEFITDPQGRWVKIGLVVIYSSLLIYYFI